ncbi:glycosyltransferase [Maribellus maritimus]|uniref:glycosyltransferase n=1 Tax=Maribellus maritimus TaxID=2870838 RepID=UPI001EEB703F|nr:glycosyltransferase [Maribellus maritimus]MCG6187063.1 glycosyltransferase [Maribellus maritimus]
MLSINIPVFNVEVNELVLELVQQAKKISDLYEINIYDDGSEEVYRSANRALAKFPKVKYIEMETNQGRAAIRNRMGFDSNYKNLLFIDADSKIIKEDYLSVFLKNAKPNRVLCGGTAYQKQKPVEKEKVLRWKYGTEREAVSADLRNRKKGFIITSNNFLIPKQVFSAIHFRENIRNYGHEDTVLGFDLFKKGVEIWHIDNPVEHTGLEDADMFLRKSKTALKNLNYIADEVVKSDPDFLNQVYFLKRFYAISKWIPTFVLRLFYAVFCSSLEANLKSQNPRIKWFDLYKLSFFSTIKNREQNVHGF